MPAMLARPCCSRAEASRAALKAPGATADALAVSREAMSR